jgi:DNA-binding MarR family transcriptional regulator
MEILESLGEHERRLYEEGFVALANDNGYVTANQRELAKATGMALKTLIPARDRLVDRGLVVRYKYAYRGKRDHYKLVDLADVALLQKRKTRIQAQRETQQLNETTMELPGLR